MSTTTSTISIVGILGVLIVALVGIQTYWIGSRLDALDRRLDWLAQ